MKKLLTTMMICLAMTLTLGAQTQQGYVKTIGKPGKKGVALSGVTVRVKGEHNAVVSKADGTFSMPMPGKKNGQAYTLQQVQKSGYELIEKSVIGRQYAFSSTVPLTIVMASTAQLQADKQRIENNAYKTAEKNYKAKMAKLEKQLQEKSISEKQYRTDLQDLQDKFEKYQNLIDELAEHYAHTDYDELSEKEAEVNILIENGELERADSLIHTLFDPVDVLKRNKESLARLDQTIAGAQGILDQANADLAAVLKQQEKDAEYLYQLYTIALAQFDNEKAARYIQTRAELDTTNVDWQNDAGEFIDTYLADYGSALKYFQRGVAQARIQFGERSEWLALLKNNIGLVYGELENSEQSLENLNAALDIRISILGEQHLSTAVSYNNIGNYYQQSAEYNKALECYEKSLSIIEEVLGLRNYFAAVVENDIGTVYSALGNYTKALEYYFKALGVMETVFGNDDPKTATVCNNIGLTYSKQGLYQNAIEYQMRALMIRQKMFVMNHPLIAASLNNLAIAYDGCGELDKALECYFKSIDINENVFGKESLPCASSYDGIGVICQMRGDYNNAIVYFQKTFDIRCRYLQENHPSLADSYRNLGTCYLYLNNLVNAYDCLNKAFIIQEHLWGLEHPETAVTNANIGMVYFYQHDFQKAQEHLESSYLTLVHSFGTEHPDTKEVKKNLLISQYYSALSKGRIADFIENHCFTATVVEGDTPAMHQGMSGEYILLKYVDWNQNSQISLIEKNNELRGKPKDIVVLKDGVISRHHFENTMGLELSIKEISKEERERINQLYEQWKREKN